MQVFKVYAAQTLAEATSFVQDLKLGHYIKVPPRATFVGACHRVVGEVFY
jgi:OPT oligopeptide transporter protein